MKYMLLIYGNENDTTLEEWTQCTKDSTVICQELATKGQFIAASPLHPVSTAVTVRVRNGQRLVTDGPFAETHEQLGGFYLLDVPNLDEAISIACRLPPVTKGTVEIRPIFNLDGLPTEKISRLHSQPETRTEYLFLCYDDEQFWHQAGETALRSAMMEAVELTHRLDQQGQYFLASPLHSASTATSVRVRQGKRLITDGPFAETREVLGGFYWISANNQQEAIEIAAQHSGARVGAVEIRPVFQLPPF